MTQQSVKLKLRQTQQLNQKQQQSLRILHMSSLELAEEVESWLADNPLLYEAEAVEDDPSVAEEEHDYLVALDGDVIFKGSVGRTDLPGGDQVQMWATLRFLASAVNPETVLLPGHGAATTMAHEHHGNPTCSIVGSENRLSSPSS